MVDVIKFYIPDVKLSDNVLKKFGKFYKRGEDKEHCFYQKITKNKIEDDDFEEPKEQIDYDKHFSIVFRRDINAEIGKLWFEQNIRRNYFSRTRTSENDFDIAVSDLTYYDFVEEIEYWANELELDKRIFWNANVTKVELGVTLHFKSPMVGIFSCFGSLKHITRKHIYDFGVKFIGDNYQVSIYDKLERAFYTKEVFDNLNKPRKENLKSAIKKIKAFIRYEIKITTTSGILPAGFKKVRTLKDIKDNWNNLGDSLLNKFNHFTFVDVISPAIEKEIIYQQFKKPIAINGRRPDKVAINEYLIFLGLEKIKLDGFRRHLFPYLKQKNKEVEKWYNDLYEKFIVKKAPTYSDEFKKVLKKRLNSIKK
ncbi:hypothetical protein LUD75_13480 [Epilithonimonas sp. JDS]|uniref:hypothetical protein n=1 Tax=Epilithonimonas sp. JDS TaxID=2902797 RepID=UPI001E2F8E52|nr:hypothetical protein [Epilithonimonas sp. JDS]MCD9855729.1 hypothetical protein [Epilithonimonas sp. JDS]